MENVRIHAEHQAHCGGLRQDAGTSGMRAVPGHSSSEFADVFR